MFVQKHRQIMKVFLLTGMLAVTVSGLNAAETSGKPEWWVESMKDLDKRMAWWEEARFALFMHWGAYSVLPDIYHGQWHGLFWQFMLSLRWPRLYL